MSIRPVLLLPVMLAVAACGAIPDGPAAPRPSTAAARPTAADLRPEVRQCVAELGKTGSRFAALPDKYYGAGCQTLGSVRIEGLGGDTGQFAVSNLGAVSCPLANSFAAWARYGVDRAARQVFRSALVRIETMGSYSCRTVAGSNRMSAHARAEAIDVAAFVLADGRRISVADGWHASAKEREFLRTVHGSACKRFGTVLGPDYNPAHRDHLHLEFGGRGYCR